MICYVSYIGIMDLNEEIHGVHLERGLNIITGKSSTGKSALIEIFDYCFGSSGYTVPEGVITEKTFIYFVFLKFNDFNLLLARKPNSKSGFIKESKEDDIVSILQQVGANFFEEKFFYQLKFYIKELSRYFKIDYSSIDETIFLKETGKSKSSTPSVRSFTSFMLQHQNLVANKHALFYRFDEKEKREQAIDHFKIFMGLVNQEYFILSQRRDEVEQKIRKLDFMIPKKADEHHKNRERLNLLLMEYHALTGDSLFDENIEVIISNPQKFINTLESKDIDLKILSNQFEDYSGALEQERSGLVSNLRKLYIKRNTIKESKIKSVKLIDSIKNSKTPESIDISLSSCPFCHSDTKHIEHASNKLVDAIDWLNNELKASTYMHATLDEEESKISKSIESIKEELNHVSKKIDRLNIQTEGLDKKISISDLAKKAKFRVEAFLESLNNNFQDDLIEQRNVLLEELNSINKDLSLFNVHQELIKIEQEINNLMKVIGRDFNFEQSYKPINLKFDLDSFDLYHFKDHRKIFLRAMGSGANWLYSHLTLFLSLHRVFASYADSGCKIPNILFLDQPTQVYFPNLASDEGVLFDKQSLHLGRNKKLDDDMSDVINIFNQLINFCEQTHTLTGVLPQIIVTDHADHLDLGNNRNFESYVRDRWRERGLISLPDDINSNLSLD